MSDHSLKIIIAGRTYPLTVKEEEVETIKKAAEDINHSVKFLRDNYAVKDMQDLLAMTALQLATKKPMNTANNDNSKKELLEVNKALLELKESLEK